MAIQPPISGAMASEKRARCRRKTNFARYLVNNRFKRDAAVDF